MRRRAAIHLSLSLSACVWLQRPADSLCCSAPVSSRLSLSLSVCTRIAERREETCDAAAVPRGGVLPFTSLSLSLRVCGCRGPRTLSPPPCHSAFLRVP